MGHDNNILLAVFYENNDKDNDDKCAHYVKNNCNNTKNDLFRDTPEVTDEHLFDEEPAAIFAEKPPALPEV